MKLAGYEGTPSEEMLTKEEKIKDPVEPVIDYSQSPDTMMDQAMKSLRAAKSLEGLDRVWRNLTAKQRKDDEVEAVKNEMHKKLS